MTVELDLFWFVVETVSLNYETVRILKVGVLITTVNITKVVVSDKDFFISDQMTVPFTKKANCVFREANIDGEEQKTGVPGHC